MILRTIKSAIPLSVKLDIRRRLDRFTIFRESLIDARRFYSEAAPMDAFVFPEAKLTHLECQIVKDYHRVEKGLSLASPKRPFGKDVRLRLDALMGPFERSGGSKSISEHAQKVADALDSWNASGAIDPDVAVLREPKDVPHATQEAWRELLSSRRSVRNFDPSMVPPALLHRAVSLAVNAPSVCNRQPWKVRIFDTHEDIIELLEFQNGNSGFREEIPCLAVITVDSALFSGAIERNQPWIEGGLFAMALSLGFQAEGLATCMLNMSVNNSAASGVRRIAKMTDSEEIIMFMAVGFESRELRTPQSPRKQLEDVAILLPSLSSGVAE